MKNSLTLYSAIKADLLKKALFIGTLIALPGILLIVGLGAWMPERYLNNFGFFAFATGIGLITYGLLPYRRLSRLESFPYKLVLDETTLILFHRDKVKLKVLFSEISHLDYFNEQREYGINIFFKDKKVKMAFLPYFSFFSYQEVKDYFNNYTSDWPYSHNSPHSPQEIPEGL